MKRLLFALCTSLALVVVSLPAAPPYYPIDQVKPGTIGTGYTVWQGDKIEEFKVHIIGVLKNLIGPKRDLILAKLEGGPLAQTGVIAGMSGSPVYIDGQLVGAVSYSLGAFSKEPIAGITPIAEMIDAATLDTPRAPIGTRARLELPVTRDSVAAAMRASMSWARPFADRSGDVQVLRRRRQRTGCDHVAADRHSAGPGRILAGCGRDAWRSVPRLWVPAGRRRGRRAIVGRTPSVRCALALRLASTS